MRRDSWSGSGFIVSEDGYVVTNNHVVAGAERIDIELHDGRVFEDVELVGRDPQTDVALLRVEGDDIAVLPIGSSDETGVGEWVLAIGSPGFRTQTGPLLSSVTAGIVSAKGRNIRILQNRSPLAIEDFIQTDAVINRGNSGGPLVNAAGEVIGINTAILSTSGNYQGYGFAVPIELAREVVDDLIEFGEVRRALIGVSITDVNAADAAFYGLDRVGGAKIQTFSFDDSPARLAGLEGGDVIVGVAGQPVSGVSELQRRIRAFEPGETVELDVVRRATLERDQARVRLIPAESDLPPRLAARPEAPEPTGDVLGLEVRDDRQLEARHDDYRIDPGFTGVLIVDADSRGAAGRAGILPGALIVDINGEEIRTGADYERIISGLGPGDAVSLQYSFPTPDGGRQSQFRSVVIPER
ncbi:MAG: PDZ domain-containing protein [Gemmatimonadales bacterium]|nr:PDZ domain-containing protein [Gemmatimonadales bacterium]